MDIFIDKAGMQLRMEGSKCLRLEEGGQLIKRIPLNYVSSVVCSARTGLDTLLIQRLADHAIPFTVLPGRYSASTIQLQNAQHTGIRVRMRQYQAHFDAHERISLARELVLKKILVGAVVVAAFCRQGVRLSASAEALCQTDDWNTRLVSTTTLAGLMGLEGHHGRIWFALLREIIPTVWGFETRNRRPPKDAVNALLSLGYTLMLAEVKAAVAHRGLDAGLGFLHEPVAGRPALALDLLELFRPVLDFHVVMQLWNGQFAEADFYPEGEGVLLTKDGRGKFYVGWADLKAAPLTALPPCAHLWSFTRCGVEDAGLSLAKLAYTAADTFAGRLLGGIEGQPDPDQQEVEFDD